MSKKKFKLTEEIWIEANGGLDAIWLIDIRFKDKKGENKGRTECFFMRYGDLQHIHDDLVERYDTTMYRVDKPYINPLEEIKRCYLS